MRILWIVLAIACLVNCGSPAPGTDETAEVGEEELEDGVWDIDCLMRGEEWEVDPLTGKILSSEAE